MKREDAVKNWIKDNFDLNEIRIEDFDLFPYGKRIVDKNGDEMVVFFDIIYARVDYRFPGM